MANAKRRFSDGKKPRTLTLKMRKFVEAYCNPMSPTFQNGRRSALSSYNAKSEYMGDMIASRLFKHKGVRNLIEKFFKDCKEIEELIIDGAKERLLDPNSRHWQATADFVAKIRGSFAPEKHEHIHMKQEDRDERYQEIMSKIYGGNPNIKVLPGSEG